MALRVLLIDDDRIELEDFRDSILWAELGFEVAGTAINGITGYEQYKRLRPDIVITDIEMPGMSGIELAEKIRETDGETKIFFLSSHEKFEYVHSGMRLDVSDYFVKHSRDLDRTRSKLLKIKKEIEEAGSKREQESERYIYGIMSGEIPPSDGQPDERYCALAVFRETAVPFFMRFSPQPADGIKRPFADLQNVVKKCCEGTVIPIDGSGALAFVETDKADHGGDSKRIDILCLDLIKMLKSEFNTRFYVIKLCAGKTVQEIKHIYERKKTLFTQRYFFDADNVLDLDSLTPSGVRAKHADGAVLAELADDPDGLNGYIDDVFDDIADKLDYKSFGDSVNTFSFHLLQMAGDAGADISELEACMSQTIGNVREAAAYIKGLYAAVREYAAGQDRYSDYVNGAMRYIARSYTDVNMSVEDIADSISLSAARLRYIFKEETGKTLHQYITDVRLDRVKQLLTDGKKRTLDTIAGQVGYLNGRYLGRVFKRETGMSPEEFKHGRKS